MQLINFVLIFAFGLVLVLFTLQNTESASIHLYGDWQFQAPLAVELLMATALGAMLSWFLVLWDRIQKFLASQQDARHLRQQAHRIQELEQDLERYKTEIEELQVQRSLPPAVETSAERMASESQPPS